MIMYNFLFISHMILLRATSVLLILSLVISSMVNSEVLLDNKKETLEQEVSTLSNWWKGIFGRDDSDTVAFKKKQELQRKQRAFVLNIIISILYAFVIIGVLYYKLGDDLTSILLLFGALQLGIDTANVSDAIVPVGILVITSILLQ